MPAQRQRHSCNQITAGGVGRGLGVGSDLYVGLYSWLSVGERGLFYITSETNCRGSCQLPYKTVSEPTTVSATEWDAALASV